MECIKGFLELLGMLPTVFHAELAKVALFTPKLGPTVYGLNFLLISLLIH